MGITAFHMVHRKLWGTDVQWTSSTNRTGCLDTADDLRGVVDGQIEGENAVAHQRIATFNGVADGLAGVIGLSIHRPGKRFAAREGLGLRVGVAQDEMQMGGDGASVAVLNLRCVIVGMVASHAIPDVGVARRDFVVGVLCRIHRHLHHVARISLTASVDSFITKVVTVVCIRNVVVGQGGEVA